MAKKLGIRRRKRTRAEINAEIIGKMRKGVHIFDIVRETIIN